MTTPAMDTHTTPMEIFDRWAKAEREGDATVLADLTPTSGRARHTGDGAAQPGSGKDAEKAAPPPPRRRIVRPNGETYVVRQISGTDDVDILVKARDASIPVLLTSCPGTGKTALFEAAFVEVGFEYLGGTADTEVADFVGTYVQHPGGEFVWVDGPLLRAMERDVPFLVDEVALIDPKVMAVVYGAMDGRREVNVTSNPERGIVKAGSGFYVVGACNPNAPGARMSEALLSRFLLHIQVGTDYALARELGVNTKAVTVAENLEVKRQSEEISWAPQMRELLAFAHVERTFSRTMAVCNLAAQAPEMDRAVVTDVLRRTFGINVAPLGVSSSSSS